MNPAPTYQIRIHKKGGVLYGAPPFYVGVGFIRNAELEENIFKLCRKIVSQVM